MDIPHVINGFFGFFFRDDADDELPAVTTPTISPTGAAATDAIAATTPTPISVPSAEPTATTASMTGALEMNVGTLNIKNSLARNAVVRCGQVAAKQGVGIWGFQEIGQTDHAPLQEGLGREYKLTHPNLQVPLAYDTRRFAHVGSGGQLTHAGLAGASPNRYIVWDDFKSLRNPGMPKFRVYNTHMVVRKDNALKAENWRIRMWEQHLKMMQQKIAEWDGLAFILGDFNPDHKPVNLPGVKWVANSGPDKIGVKSPAAIRAAFVDSNTFRNPSDHAGLTARFMIRGNR